MPSKYLNKSRLKPRTQGFTLIEVLLAMSITAVAALIAYQGLDSAARLAEASEAEAKSLQSLSAAMHILSQDLQYALPRKIRNPDGSGFQAAFTFSEFETPQLQLTRGARFNPQPKVFQRSEIERVAYHVDDGKFTRYSWPQLDRYSDAEPYKNVLIKGVKQVQYRFLEISLNTQNVNVNNLQNKKTWYTQWPANANAVGNASLPLTTLPHAVEITLETEQWGKITRLFDLVEVEY